MSKIIKLKIIDIENIVRKTIEEQEMDYIANENTTDVDEGGSKPNISIGKDENGKIYVINNDTETIIASK